MRNSDLKKFFHLHCKIKLRSGKEVFGVVWEELTDTQKAIYFASYYDHKRLMALESAALKKDAARDLLMLSGEDILAIEQLYSD